MSNFTLAVKSTIDKLGHDLASNLNINFIDLDDLVATSELFKTVKDAIVWELMTLDETPSDPLYSVNFKIGARTVKDIANYNVLRLLDTLKVTFPIGTSIPISDYSEAVVGPRLGYMYITGTNVDPQMYDKDSGVRMVLVSARCVREA